MANRVGQHLGNYRLQRLLGEGGFAEVYLGEQVHLGTPAAIKVLSARLTAEEIEQFRQEARTIALLKHPHIVRMLDFGVEGGVPYLVMEYAVGGTLRQRHPKGARLSPEAIVPYVQQVASALQYAHDKKLVHRDIKPENMLLGESEEILLSDFGIALLAQSSRYQSTQDTAGTIAYMAPEQIQGHPRPASDQYSLGIVIYEWLAGERPFTGSMSEVVAQHLGLPPPPLRDRLPNFPPELEQVVFTALEKDPKARYASVQAFARALDLASQEALLASGNAPELALLPSLPLDPSALAVPSPVPVIQRSTPALPSLPLDPSAPAVPSPVPATQQTTPPPSTSVPPAAVQTTPPPSTSVPPAAVQTTPPPASSKPGLPTTERALATTQVASAPPFSMAGESTQVEATLPAPSAEARDQAAVRAMVQVPQAPERRRPARRGRLIVAVLSALLLLVVVGGSLLWLGLAGQGPFAVPRTSSRATLPTATRRPPATTLPTATATPRPVGVITEFAVPTANGFAYGNTFAPGAYGFPDGITAGPGGNLWFTEYFGYRIGSITPGGSITEFVVPSHLAPAGERDGLAGIAAGPDGNLWFTEVLGSQIVRSTPLGSITEFPLPYNISEPQGITAGLDGNLWFTENKQIGRITPLGNIIEFALPTANSYGGGITAGSDGTLWFTECVIAGSYCTNGRIGRITPGGSITEYALPSANSIPIDIIAGPDGNLWFTECTDQSSIGRCTGGRIGRSTPTGQITEFALPTANSLPEDITAGPDGNLWFTECTDQSGELAPTDTCTGGRIGRSTPAGSITEYALPTANSFPIGIAAGPDGNLWFTECVMAGYECTNSRIGRITSGR